MTETKPEYDTGDYLPKMTRALYDALYDWMLARYNDRNEATDESADAFEIAASKLAVAAIEAGFVGQRVPKNDEDISL